MKILYISKSIIPSDTANSINVMKMCEAFADNGCDIDLLIPDTKLENEKKKETKYEPYEYYGVKKNFSIHKIRSIAKHVKEAIDYTNIIKTHVRIRKPDLIYFRDNSIRYLLHEIGIPVVIEIHREVADYESIFESCIKSENLRKLIVINNYLYNYYKEKYNLSPDKLFVAHSGGDDRNSTDKVHLKGNNSFRIGYIGHLYSGKGMEIISELIKICQWADFHIVGGTEEDISNWKSKLFMFDNVFFHGHISHSQVYKYINTFDILLAPYKKEISIAGGGELSSDCISPLKIFEYMSSGKAIVASDLPALREVLEYKDNAILCNTDNVYEWVNSLKLLYKDEAQRKKIGTNARKEFLNKYTWDARAKNILDAISI
jgi:glycosyltransferase involved in cell wall biosynthesis